MRVKPSEAAAALQRGQQRDRLPKPFSALAVGGSLTRDGRRGSACTG